jgi:hypothetical protein
MCPIEELRRKRMKKFLMIALFCLPSVAWAGHLDVFPFTLKESCSVDALIQIKDDFNTNWGEEYAYQVEIASPLQSNDMSTIYWMGRSKSVAAFGAAADAWIEGIKDPESVAGKLNARLSDCLERPEARRSYLVN